MSKPLASSITLTIGILAFAHPGSTQAGQPLYGPTGKEAKSQAASPLEPVPGAISLGGEFSSHLQSVYFDSITPFWHPGNATIFLNTRNDYNDIQQYVSSYGLGARYLVPDHEVILGVNGYYDSIDSQYENQFRSAGFGAEILTHWVDARFNYYLPASDDILVHTTHRTSFSRTVVGPFQNGNQIQTNTITRTRKQTFQTFEAELEGFNAEVGFLIPGLDRYMETRVFGGYYHYNNPFGRDYDGFKARLEAHLLRGVIGDVEWWNDSYLNGGHWIANVRVSLPFSFFNLFSGRNPFEGASDSFKPGQREFRERLSDMVDRSHRVKTVKSGEILTDERVSSHTVTTTTTVPSTQTPGGTGTGGPAGGGTLQ